MINVLKNIFKIIAWLSGSLLLLFIVLIFLIRLPSVQNYVTHKATGYVSSKTHTIIELKRLYIVFPKSIVIEGLFAEDRNHDTLIAIGQLELNVNLYGLLNKKVEVNNLLIADLNSHIKRILPDSSFNFNFILKAFSSDVVKKEPLPKDTVAWKIIVNSIVLQHIQATFSDEVSGMNMLYEIGNLKISLKDMDIKTMRFDGDELSLTDANVRIIKTKYSPATIDTITTVLPAVSLHQLKLHQVQFYFADETSGILIAAKTKDLLAKPEHIDLNAQIIKVNELEINDASTIVAVKKNTNTNQIPDTTNTINKGWQIQTDKLSLEKVNVRFDITNEPRQGYGMDYNHLFLTNVNTDIEDAFYSPEKISATVRHLSLHEQCGLDLQQLSSKIEYDDQHAAVKDLSIKTTHSSINTDLEASYSSISKVSKSIGELGIHSNFRNCKIAFEDVFLFAPVMRNQTPFKGKSGEIIFANGKINGLMKNLYATNLILRAGQTTALVLDGHIIGLPDAKNSFYDINMKSFVTKKSDVLKWIPQKNLPVNIPSAMLMKGTFKGSLTDLKTNVSLKTSSGDVQINASVKKVNADTIYAITLITKQLDAGYIFKQDSLIGTVTLNTTIKGKNFAPENLEANIVTEINSVELHKKEYHNIVLTADADREKYTATVIVNDSNIQMNMQALVSLVKNQEALFMDLDLAGADLNALKLTRENIRTKGKLNIDLKGRNLKNLTGRISLNNVLVLKDDKKYRIDSFLVAAVNDKKHSSLKMKSGFINIDYEGSLTLVNLKSAIVNHINNYYTITKDSSGYAEKDTSEQDFKLAIKILPHPILNEVLFTKLKNFRGADITGDFNNVKQELNLVVKIPVLEYDGNNTNDVNAEVHSDKNAMNYSFAVSSFRSGSINLPKTNLYGNLQKNILSFALAVFHKDSGNKLFVAGNIKQKENEKYVFHLDQNLVFNNQKWLLSQNHDIIFENSGVYVQELSLNNNQQSITLRSDGKDETAPLKIIFKQFELGTISQIAEHDTSIVRGLMNGTFEIRNLQKSPAFVSDLKVSNIVYLQNPVGDLSIQADNLSANKYSVHLALSGQDNKADIKGTYFSSEDQRLDFIADISKINFKTIESFSKGQLRNSSGYLTGNIHITGTGNKPLMNGEIGFKDASFNVAYMNDFFKLKDEHFKIDPEGIYFKSFSILDESGQKASVEGAVYTTDFTRMNFDLTVKTNNFTVLNTTIRDNPLYFGKILLSSTMRIRGNELLPVITIDAKLLSGSRITVIVPSSQLSTDKGEGVVVLIDTSKTNDIMNHTDTVRMATLIKGIDLTANIEVNRNTTFKVIVDRVSGDSLVVKGDGLLSFSIDPGGKQSLTGNYVLSDGSYNASFQKVIKRDFKIKPGSSISWSGSPLDATVDITAIYRTKTSPADLLSNELAGAGASELTAYRKLLSFDVNMMMKGALIRPDISFMIDMQDKDKNAFGGIVYSKISSLNNDAAELNKQVFALLVMNKFIPTGSAVNTGEASVVNTVARNSVNQVLGDQLNQLSGKYVKGVELNFDLESNDQYTGTSVQQNTQVQVGLKKEFLNNRMSVQVGSNINVQDNGTTTTDANNLTGDAIVEYKITDDGRFRFKAFRENQYEGIIDGMLYKTGVGIIYTKDFDSISEIFSSPEKEETVAEVK